MIPHTCRIILNNGFLGKRIFHFKVPADIMKLANKYERTFMGMGQWNNNEEEPYLCICRPLQHPLYFNKETLRDMQKQIKGER